MPRYSAALTIEPLSGQVITPTPLPSDPIFCDDDGFVRQCSGCRRVRSAAAGDRWVTVRRWIAGPPENTSHGLCPACLDRLYPSRSAA